MDAFPSARASRVGWILLTLVAACGRPPDGKPPDPIPLDDAGAPTEADSGSQAPDAGGLPDAGPTPILRALRLEPSALRLDGVGATSLVRVRALYEHARDVEVTDKAAFSSRDPAVARVKADGAVTAIAKGRTTIAATFEGLSRELPVTVAVDEAPPAFVEFFNRTQLVGIRKPVWFGQTEPYAIIDVTGGEKPVKATADEDGQFVLELSLKPNTINTLSVVLSDRKGNKSSPYLLDVEEREGLPRSGWLSLVSGNGQTGIVGKETGAPLKVIATGPGGVALVGKKVTFRALADEGSFAGQSERETLTDAEGKVTATPTLGFRMGGGKQRLLAVLEGDFGHPVLFALTAAVPSAGPTRVSGSVLTEETTAIPGATVWLKDSRGVVLAKTTTDARGDFTFTGIAAGRGYSLLVDGTSVTLPGRYPDMIFDVNVLAGIENRLPAPVILPKLPQGVPIPLDASGAVTTTIEIKVSVNPRLPPMVLTFPKGTKVTFPPGVAQTEKVIRLVSVPTFGVPMPFPNGLATANVIAVQPANTLFDPPLPLKMPNVDEIAPGTKVKLFSFDHALKDYRLVGPATVDSSGTYVVSDPGSGIRKGAWHMAPPPEPNTFTLCGDLGPPPGARPPPGGHDPGGDSSGPYRDPDPWCTAPSDCTCLGPGAVSVACAPGKRVCLPNAAVSTAAAIRVTCPVEPNQNTDGSKVRIRLSSPQATFPVNTPITVEAETCPPGLEDQVVWSIDPRAPDGTPVGPSTGKHFVVKYAKPHPDGTLVTATLKNSQDSVVLVIDNRCTTVGVLDVCGPDAGKDPPAGGGPVLIKGPVSIGLAGRIPGARYDGDVQVDPVANTVKSVPGGPSGMLSVDTAPVRFPFGQAPFSLDASKGEFGQLTIPGALTGTKVVLHSTGLDLTLDKAIVIDGGVEVAGKLNLPAGWSLSATDATSGEETGPSRAVPLSRLSLVATRRPMLAGAPAVKLEVGSQFSVDGTVRLDYPGKVHFEGKTVFKGGDAKAAGFLSAVTMDARRGELSIKAGVQGMNIPLPGAASFLAMKELSLGMTKPFAETASHLEPELAAGIATNSARTDLASGVVSAKGQGQLSLFDTLSLRGEVGLLKGLLKVANGKIEASKTGAPARISGDFDFTAEEPGTKRRNGIVASGELTVTQGLAVTGRLVGAAMVFGQKAESRSIDVEGKLTADPYITATGSSGPFSVSVRVDTKAPFVHVRTLANQVEKVSKVLGGASVTLPLLSNAPAAMIVVKRGLATPGGFSIVLPDGTEVKPPGIKGATYFADGLSGTSLYILDAAKAGNYTVKDVASPANVTSVALSVPNAPPSIELDSVQQTAPGTFTIGYTAKDVDDTAKVALLFDTDDALFNGQEIAGAEALAEADGAGQFSWTPKDIPSGDYYVYVRIDDGHDQPMRVYAPNRARIVDSKGAPIPSGVRAVSGAGSARLEFRPVAGADRYVVRLERAGFRERRIELPGSATSIEIDRLENGATYRATVAAVTAGHVGGRSEAVQVAPRSPGSNVPQIDSRPPGVARVGKAYRYQLLAKDEDTGDLSLYELAKGPAGMAISKTGEVTFTPVGTQEGAHAVVVNVRDGKGLTAVQEFTLRVVGKDEANTNPAIVSEKPELIVPGQAFSHTVQASDADGDAVAYALASAPQGMTIDSASGKVSWTPQTADLKIHGVNVVVKASDANGGAALQRWQLIAEDSDGDGLRDGFELANALDPFKADTDGNGTKDGDEDPDADGLTNVQEQKAGTAPKAADTDGDTLSDKDETTKGTDPLRADSDGDSLNDKEEQTKGTDPLKRDTDGDGAPDGEELRSGTDPLKKSGDTDGDGLTDDLEAMLGTSPRLADTDGDTLSDADEMKNGTSPLLSDTDGDQVNDAKDLNPLAGRDTDGDGLSDDHESVLKTNPMSRDTDGDGRSDGMEVAAKLDPLDPKDNPKPPLKMQPLTGVSKTVVGIRDALLDVGLIALGDDGDKDGMPDAYEVTNGLNPNDASDALKDADTDGLSNVSEYRMGTDPKKADTDGDGVNDGDELRAGTDPRDPKSNRVGVTLKSLEVRPASFPLTLNTIEGPRPYPLRVTGVLTDGGRVDMTPATTGTTYSSSAPTRLAVSADGELLPTPGPDLAVTVTVKNGAASATAAVQLKSFSPAPVATLDLGGGATERRIAKSGDRLFLARSTGLLVVDAQRPKSMRVLSNTPMDAMDVAVGGTIAYVATPAGVVFLDVSDAAKPRQVGTVPVAKLHSVVVEGGYVYATAGDSLVIAKADAPTSASLVDRDSNGVDDRIVGTLKLAGPGTRLSVQNGLAAIAGESSVMLADVRDPRNPTELSAVPAATAVVDVDVSSTTAVAVTKNRTLLSVDVGLGASASVLGRSTGWGFSASTYNPPFALAVYGEFAFVEDHQWSNSTYIWRTTDLRSLGPPAGTVSFGTGNGNMADDPVDIAVDRSFVYALAQGGKVFAGQYRAISDAAGRAPEVYITAPSGGTNVVEATAVAMRMTATDDVAVESVELLVDGKPAGRATATPYEFKVKAQLVSQPTPLRIEARATDFAGNIGVSQPITITVVPDSGPPTVTFVSPLANAKVAGVVRVSVSAVDDGTVEGVELFAGATSLGKVLSAPFQVGWNTLSLSNGPQKLKAVATDAKGQTGSAEIDVAIEDLPPKVSIIAPGVGATVGGKVAIEVNASDDIDVTSVKIFADGKQLVERARPPYEATWDACPVTPGSHVVSATATDGRGQTATGLVAVTVDNSNAPPSIAASGRNQQVTLRIETCVPSPVFNVYWSSTPGVTTASTRIAGVTSPFVQKGLTNGAVYYYRAALVAGGQEGPLSNEARGVPRKGACDSGSWCLGYPFADGVVHSVWGTSASDVWTAGADSIHHWDGGEWITEMVGMTMQDVWGSGPNDVWAVGNGGMILRWNGTAWASVSSGTTRDLWGVWGSGPNDVWAVGSGGMILRWNGTAWASVSSGTPRDLRGVWGSGSSDVWAVGNGGLILRWNGTAWTSFGGGTPRDLWGVWGSGPNDVWAVGVLGDILRFSGTAWSTVKSGTNASLVGVWGSGPSDVWAAGSGGVMLRWNGTAWASVSSGTPELIYAIWGSGKDEVWAAGENGAMLRWNGTTWSSGSAITYPLSNIWGIGPNDVWVVGQLGTIARWNGTAWSRLDGGTRKDLRGVWASAANDVWAVGHEGTIIRWNGTVWSSVNRSAREYFYGVWGSGPNDVWAVGPEGTVLRWNGAAWTSVNSGTTAALADVWGSGPNDVWAVGWDGTILHWNGTAWSSARRGTNNWLNDVWGSGPNDVWAVGDSGTVLRWNGSTWSSVNSGVERLTAVWGTGPNDVWVTGVFLTVEGRYKGQIAHWDGTAWTTVKNPSFYVLSGIWGSGPSDVWAVGSHIPTSRVFAAILRYQP